MNAAAEARDPSAQQYSGPGVQFDEAAFDPMKIMAVRHTLMAHPLLQLPALVELGRRLGAKNSVRYHDDKASAGTDFTHAPQTNKVDLPAEEVIRRIESAGAWLALHNIQNDDLYRTLVDEVLDHVRPRVDRKDPGMHYRAGWIFITSPGAVTPYHMDHEHNFILQIRGKKTLHVWEALDRQVVTERSLELFHEKHSRELVQYREENQQRARVFELEPGMGGYMPTTSPHWVKNGDNVSITVSFTYYTEMTRRRKLLHRANYELRRLGLSPDAVRESTPRDLLKHALFRPMFRAKDVARKALGRATREWDKPYADSFVSM